MKVLESGMDKVVKDVSAETPEPFARRRADALAMLAESYLENGPAASSSADRYQVMVHVSAESSAEDSYVENGPAVSAQTRAAGFTNTSRCGPRKAGGCFRPEADFGTLLNGP